LPNAYESLRAWLFRRELDRRIAHGADPRSSPELTRRASQLVSRDFRARMAAGLRRTIAAAEQPWQQRLTAQVPVQRGAILDERALLIGLARLLTEEERCRHAAWRAWRSC
jgi:CHASE3 domain sensor protein